MSKMGREKGARGERMVLDLLRGSLGGEWSRTPQSGGWGNRTGFQTCGDVITTLPMFGWTIEVKNQEGWNLEQILAYPEKCVIVRFWQQCKREAKEANKHPLLVFTRNFQPLFAIVPVKEGPQDLAMAWEIVIDGDLCTLALFDENFLLQCKKTAMNWPTEKAPSPA